MPRTPKLPRMHCDSLSNAFERRSEKDFNFLKTQFSSYKIVQVAIQIFSIGIFAYFNNFTNDGIFASACICHVLYLILNLAPLWVGVTLKNRNPIIIIFEFGTIILMVIFSALIYNSLKESDGPHDLYYDYTIFYHSSLKSKLSNFFTMKLVFAETLIVLLPVLIGVDIILFFFERKFLNADETAQKTSKKVEAKRSNEVSNVGTLNPRNSASGSTRIKPSSNLEDFYKSYQLKRQVYPNDYPKSSKSPDLNRIREAPSLESLERKEAELEKRGRESKKVAMDSCNLTEEQTDSEKSSLNEVKIDTEDEVVRYRRSSLMGKSSSQENFEQSESPSKEETESEKSVFEDAEKLPYDPQRYDKKEIVRSVDKGMKSNKHSENYCERSFNRSSKSSSASQEGPKEGSSCNKEISEHEDNSKKIKNN